MISLRRCRAQIQPLNPSKISSAPISLLLGVFRRLQLVALSISILISVTLSSVLHLPSLPSEPLAQSDSPHRALWRLLEIPGDSRGRPGPAVLEQLVEVLKLLVGLRSQVRVKKSELESWTQTIQLNNRGLPCSPTSMAQKKKSWLNRHKAKNRSPPRRAILAWRTQATALSSRVSNSKVN